MIDPSTSTTFVDALGSPLSIGDVVVFLHKTTHSRHSRGTPRYVKARITGVTAKMLVVEWLVAQQVPGAEANADLTQAPHSGHWDPERCVRVSEPSA